jgi:hypothetical protein
MLEYELTVTLILFHYEVASRITKVGVGILGPPLPVWENDIPLPLFDAPP